MVRVKGEGSRMEEVKKKKKKKRITLREIMKDERINQQDGISEKGKKENLVES